jgi:hypothetical protein
MFQVADNDPKLMQEFQEKLQPVEKLIMSKPQGVEAYIGAKGNT